MLKIGCITQSPTRYFLTDSRFLEVQKHVFTDHNAVFVSATIASRNQVKVLDRFEFCPCYYFLVYQLVMQI